MFYSDGQCHLCPRNCKIEEGKIGACRVRQMKDGRLYSLVYGKVAALNMDPIEKKPLFHFLPGEHVLSFGTSGCNLMCKHCQNWELSSGEIQGRDMQPEDLIKLAEKHDCRIIAATYNEPTIFYEFMYDTFKLAKEKGMKTVVVTNGYINKEPLEKLLPVTDAFNVDLKAFTEDFYKNVTSASLQPVLDTIKRINKWLELTTLIIPGHNDSMEELGRMFQWIIDNKGKDVPVHLSAFHPSHQMMDVSPTPLETLKKARDKAKETGLNYVYLGNVMGDNNTRCPVCDEKVIDRTSGQINDCGHSIPGVFTKDEN